MNNSVIDEIANEYRVDQSSLSEAVDIVERERDRECSEFTIKQLAARLQVGHDTPQQVAQFVLSGTSIVSRNSIA